MTAFEVNPMRRASVMFLYGLKSSINVSPPYQRQGEVWTVPKQQLLIDSLLNGFDVPTIYLHDLDGWGNDGGEDFRYAVVDGRQRLEAIWGYMTNEFPLSKDFVHLESGSTDIAGLYYGELTERHPREAALLSATPLDVMLIRTDDLELVEEMFSRLNEAVPLNAAEKRNGRGGPLRDAASIVIGTDFFTRCVPFGNTRFRHLDLATKILLWTSADGPAEVKKPSLDQFWESFKQAGDGATRATAIAERAVNVLSLMSQTFEEKDRLLTSVGMVSVYFLLFQERLTQRSQAPIRAELERFESVRKVRDKESDEDLPPFRLRLLEFDRLAQSPNDASALTIRLSILRDFLADPSRFRNAQISADREVGS